MPVPVRDTPLGRELYEEGRHDGRQEGRQQGERTAVVRLTTLMLQQRFGDDSRCTTVATALADLHDEERLTRLAAAESLDDLLR